MTKRESEQSYYLREDALDFIGVRQSMFQLLCSALGIGSIHFDGVRGQWYAREDLELIRTYRREPWRKDDLKQQVKHHPTRKPPLKKRTIDNATL